MSHSRKKQTQTLIDTGGTGCGTPDSALGTEALYMDYWPNHVYDMHNGYGANPGFPVMMWDPDHTDFHFLGGVLIIVQLLSQWEIMIGGLFYHKYTTVQMSYSW